MAKNRKKFLTLILVAIVLVITLVFVIFVFKNKKMTGSLGATPNASGAKEIANSDEWIWYTGTNSNVFTFKYPKSYVYQEYSTSVLLYPSEQAKNTQGSDHLTFSSYPADPNNRFDLIANCESFSKTMASSADDSIGKGRQFIYAKVISLGNIQVCDAGLSMIQTSNEAAGRMYEFSLNFTANQTKYGIIGYANEEKNLEILHKIAETFQLK